MSGTKTSGTAERPRSLRRRLMVEVGLGFAVILGLLTIALWSYGRNAANQSYDLLLNGASLAILERSHGLPEGPSVDIPYSALEMVGLAKDDRVFYRVFDGNGTLLTGDPDLPLPTDYEPTDAPVYFDAPHSGETVRFILHGRRLTALTPSEWIVVQIGHTRRARDTLEHEIIANGLVLLLFVAAVGLAFVWLGIRRSLAPLTGIERDLREREPSDLTPMEAEPPREIRSLVASINGFILRLKTNQEHAQAFIADVAHQIRTALSALQGQLDMASRQTDTEAMRARLRRAEAQSQRTVRLTNQLLSHAMVIHRADNIPRRRIDLMPLLRRTLEETVRDTMTRDIDFGLVLDDFPDGAFVLGDPVALREALRNLLDNAIKHGPEDNRIDLGLHSGRTETGTPALILSVEDAGPGIPADRHAAAFERFQSFDTHHKGSGLGLSIVRAVAESHRGTVALDRSQAGGLRVAITLPRVQP